MSRPALLGIFRETLHSPDRVGDDARILQGAASVLRSQGMEVELATPERLGSLSTPWEGPRPELVFLMCEQERMLAPLGDWEQEGTICINAIEGIRNTYRRRMLRLWAESGIPFPKSEIVRPGATPGANRWRNEAERWPLWVKRGDVHNAHQGDVSAVRSHAELGSVLEAFASRKVTHAILQHNVEGDLVKFYGIGRADEAWFQWFYHRDQEIRGHSFSGQELRRACFKAAAALGLEIFGGDAVVTASGAVFLIDLNAWPSFALFREEASEMIARHILSRLPAVVS